MATNMQVSMFIMFNMCVCVCMCVGFPIPIHHNPPTHPVDLVGRMGGLMGHVKSLIIK